MTDLLDNALVRKYFGCKAWGGCPDDSEINENEHIALRIVIAMQEPIRKGESFIHLQETGYKLVKTSNGNWSGFHPFALRLPSRFQTQPHECNCEFCGSPETVVLGETPEERAKRTGQPEKCKDCGKTEQDCKATYCWQGDDQQTTGAEPRCKCAGGCCC